MTAPHIELLGMRIFLVCGADRFELSVEECARLCCELNRVRTAA